MTTVLIVDDSRLARDMVGSILAALHPDWTVISAVSADDALARIEQATPEVALVDVNMPGMDGLTLAGLLRERFPDLRIAILTANVQESLRRKADTLGCVFIPKPATADKIRAFLTPQAA